MIRNHPLVQLIEKYISIQNGSKTRKFQIAISLAIAGLSFDYLVYHFTGVYLTAPTMLIVSLIAFFTGFKYSITAAVILSTLSDYFFIPPIGQIFENVASFEHFTILVTSAVITSYLVASLREAFLRALQAKNEAERASNLMEHVLAFVSHDLLTPLTSIRMAAEFILKTPKQFEKHEAMIANILINIDRAKTMIHSLLDVANIRAGKSLQMSYRYCDLRVQVKEIVAEMNLFHSNRLILISAESLWGKWGLDGIRRALENLVTNAIKYGDSKAPITIELKRNDELATLSVHNVGQEIPLAEQSGLFEYSHRTPEAKLGTVKGWGLGLALVKGIAEAHGGTVEVQSSREAGTTFKVHLPIRTEKQKEASGQDQKAA